MASPDTPAAAPAERIVHVDLGARAYDVLVGADLVARAGDMIISRFGKARAAIVTDENVARHHLPALEASLRTFDRHLGTIILPPGEATKCFAELGRLSESLLALKLERGETILRFTVQRDGTITNVDFDKRSGSGILDRASLDALPAKLAQPLPREYPENQLVIHLKFPYQARE